MYEMQIGQQVVCVIDTWLHKKTGLKLNYPVEHGIYTIRDIIPDGFLIGLYFEEIVNPSMKWNDGSVRELLWSHTNFRPVKKTNIDTFLKILKDVDKKLTLENV